MKPIAVILVISLISFLGGCHGWFKKQPSVLDSSGVADQSTVESIVVTLCDQVERLSSKASGDGPQISRVSTVESLIRHFEAIGDTTCKRRVLGILKDLINLIQAHNHNVCSDEKISLIESFHRKYVSTAKEDLLTYQREGASITKMLKLFFMHYAVETSAVCKISLINNLEWDTRQQLSDQDLELGHTGLLNKILSTFGEGYTVDSVQDHDDIVLLWELQSEPNAAGESTLGEFVDKATGKPVKGFMKVRDSRSFRELQSNCRTKLKPFYSKLILPVMRLSNLGYSWTGDRLARELTELKENEMVKRWYGLTQICEVVVPVKFYSDSELAPNEIIFITNEEAARISAEQPEQDEPIEAETRQALDYEPTTNVPTVVDKLNSVETEEAQNLIGKIKSSVTARERALRRVLKRMGSAVKNFIKTKASALFFSRKVVSTQDASRANKDGFVKEDMSPVLDKWANLTDDDLVEAGQAGIVKRKRRVRQGDADFQASRERESLSYMHTKTWGEIINGWGKQLEKIMPGKWIALAVIITCVILISIFVG